MVWEGITLHLTEDMDIWGGGIQVTLPASKLIFEHGYGDSKSQY